MRTHPKAWLSRPCRGCWCGCGSWRRGSRRCAAGRPAQGSPESGQDPATRRPPRTQGKCASCAPGPLARPGWPRCGCLAARGAPGPSSERSLGALTPAESRLAGCPPSCYEACGGHGWCLISPKGRPFSPPLRLRSTWTAGENARAAGPAGFPWSRPPGAQAFALVTVPRWGGCCGPGRAGTHGT